MRDSNSEQSRREGGPSIWLRDLAGSRTVIGWFGYKPPRFSRVLLLWVMTRSATAASIATHFPM